MAGITTSIILFLCAVITADCLNERFWPRQGLPPSMFSKAAGSRPPYRFPASSGQKPVKKNSMYSLQAKAQPSSQSYGGGGGGDDESPIEPVSNGKTLDLSDELADSMPLPPMQSKPKPNESSGSHSYQYSDATNGQPSTAKTSKKSQKDSNFQDSFSQFSTM